MNKYTSYLFIIICFVSNATKAQWTLIASGTLNNLTQIVFPDSLTGYILTDKPIDTISSAFVLKTTDGGYTWSKILSKHGRLNGIDFLSADTGVVIGSASYDTCYKTFDGGNHWIKMKMQYNVGNLFHMNSVNEWVYLTGQHWGYTPDGGNTWIDSSNGNSGLLPIITSEFQFMHDTVIGFGGYPSEVFKSVDRGKSWPILLCYAPTSSIQSGCFPTSATGFYIFNSASYYNVLKSTDGGVHWTKIDSVNGYNVSCIKHVDANTLYTVGSKGYIAATADGGNTWTQQASGTSQGLAKIVFLPNKAIVIGDSGTILMHNINRSTVTGPVKNSQLISVFPNPCIGTVHITSSSFFDDVSVYDAMGKMVFNVAPIHSTHYIADITSLSVGYYLVQISFANQPPTYIKIMKIE